MTPIMRAWLRTFSLSLVLGGAWASVISLLVFAVIAMTGDGSVKVHFNNMGEGWVEVAAMTVLTTAYPIALVILQRRWRRKS